MTWRTVTWGAAIQVIVAPFVFVIYGGSCAYGPTMQGRHAGRWSAQTLRNG
ncbi:hypothetical protein HKK72_08080 [Actinomadura sp. HBU206391]|nr:hypothetical protein [Actinomadura sp. HBU206391]